MWRTKARCTLRKQCERVALLFSQCLYHSKPKYQEHFVKEELKSSNFNKNKSWRWHQRKEQHVNQNKCKESVDNWHEQSKEVDDTDAQIVTYFPFKYQERQHTKKRYYDDNGRKEKMPTEEQLQEELLHDKTKREEMLNELAELSAAMVEVSDQLFDTELCNNDDHDNSTDDVNLLPSNAVEGEDLRVCESNGHAIMTSNNNSNCELSEQVQCNSSCDEMTYDVDTTKEIMEMLLEPPLSVNTNNTDNMNEEIKLLKEEKECKICSNTNKSNKSIVNVNKNISLQTKSSILSSSFTTTNMEHNLLTLLSTNVAPHSSESTQACAIISKVLPELFNGLDWSSLLQSHSLQSMCITHKQMQRCNLTGVYWSNVKCISCIYTRSIFYGASMNNCYFSQCNFDGCIMKRVRVHGTVKFVHCSFRFAAIGIERSAADTSIEFIDCDFDLADFSGSSGLSHPRCFKKCHKTHSSTLNFPLRAGHADYKFNS